MKTLLSSVVVLLLAAPLVAQQMDPYQFRDPDAQEAVHWYNEALRVEEEDFTPALQDVERVDSDLRGAIRVAQDDAGKVSEFTARMASAETGGFLAGILGGLDLTTLLLILMGGGGVAGGLVANKKRRAAEMGRVAAEKGKETAEKIIHRAIPKKQSGNGKAHGYSVPEGMVTGEYDIEAAKVAADASRS